MRWLEVVGKCLQEMRVKMAGSCRKVSTGDEG